MSGWVQDLAKSAQAVTVLLAGPPRFTEPWYAFLSGDPRFRVVSQTHDPADLQARLAVNPDVLFLEATLFPDPDAFLRAVQGLAGRVRIRVFYPPDVEGHIQSLRDRLPQNLPLHRTDENLVDIAHAVHREVTEARRQEAGWQATQEPAAGPRRVTGVQIVGVWAQTGGVGKTTLATSLAFAAAQRGIPTLLVGLGAPDDLPVNLGLKRHPNITMWRLEPTPESLKKAVQPRDGVDVLAGFPDVLSEAQTLIEDPNAPSSMKNLVDQAVRLGYGAILFDLPPTALASVAFQAISRLVLVARPSTEGVVRAVEAYKTVVQRLAILPPEAVHVVLNRVGHRLSPEAWQNLASQILGQPFPTPIVIPDDPRVGQAQDEGLWPPLRSQALRSAVEILATDLFGPLSTDGYRPRRRVFRIRLGRRT